MAERAQGGLFAILPVVLLLIPCVFSQQNDSIANFAYGLDADITVANNSLEQSPSVISATIKVRNGEDADFIVYLLAQDSNGVWAAQKILGIVQKGSNSQFTVDFGAKYSGKTNASTQYAVVATGGAVPLGKYFSVQEDWSPYEKGETAKIMDAAQILAPVLIAVILAVLLILAHWAYKSKSYSPYEKEYTLKTFFLPVLKQRNASEIGADILINPVFWALEAMLLVIVAATIWGGADLTGHKAVVIGLTLIGAFIMPLVYFVLVWMYNSLVEKMPLRFLAGAFMWGITAAIISLVLNSMQAQFLSDALGLDKATIVLLTTALIAPLIEEVAKGLGLLVLWGHHEFSDALHGLHLGLAVGLGFAFVENWLYFASKTDPLQMGLAAWTSIIIYRSFFNSIAHACFSATLGASMGWAKSHRLGKIGIVSFLPGVLVATMLHSIFNITAIMDGFEAFAADFPVYKYNTTMIVTLLSIIVILLIGATIERKQAKRRMKP